MSQSARRIALDRRVCVVRPDRIDVRPERSALIGPLVGLALSVSMFVAVALFANQLPVAVLALMLIPGLLLAPFSAMALLYSLIGAAVVIERKKQSIRFQQGVLGLGLGTVELVPFWKVDHIEVADFELGDVTLRGLPPPVDLRAWEVLVVKKSGKRLPVGQVFSPNVTDLIDEGFGRALDAAEAIAAMAGSEVAIMAALEEEPAAAARAEQREEPAGRTEPAPGQRT